MGCDIHAHVEVYTNQWDYVDDLELYRSYGLFGFLADIRNYSCVPPITKKAQRGLPSDISEDLKDLWENEYDRHSPSYVNLKELLDFDYSQVFEDRRTNMTVNNVTDGAHICEPGQGERTTFKAFLGPHYFKILEQLKQYGEPDKVRLVFWFDN